MPVECARVARTCSRFNIGENDDKMVVKRHLIVLWSEASRVDVVAHVDKRIIGQINLIIK